MPIFKKKEKDTYYDMPQGSYITDSTYSIFTSDIKDALTNSLIFSAVNIISSAISALPCFIYSYDEQGVKRVAREHRGFYLLHDAPNPDLIASDFFQTLMIHLLLLGNCYIKKIKDNSLRVSSLEIMNPYEMEIKIENSQKIFVYKKNEKYNREQIIHIKGLSENGVSGVNVLTAQSSSIDLINTLNKFTRKYFKNSANLGGVIKATEKLGASQEEIKKKIDTLKESFSNSFTGLDNAGKTPILDYIWEYKPLNISAKDAVLVEALNLMVQEVARIFNIPVSKLASIEKTSFASLEADNQNFLNSLLPWLRKIEQSFNKDFFSVNEQGKYFIEFKLDSFLRASYNDRLEGYSKGIVNGIYTRNEVRALENLPPLPPEVGDEVFIQLNTAKIEKPTRQRKTKQNGETNNE